MNDEHARKVAEIEATMGDLVPEKKAEKLKSSIANDALHAVSGIGWPTSSATMAQIQSAISAHQAKQKADLISNWGALAGQFKPYPSIAEAQAAYQMESKRPMTASEIAQRHANSGIASYGKPALDAQAMQMQHQIDAMTQVMLEQMHMAANPPMILRDPQAAQMWEDMSRVEIKAAISTLYDKGKL